MQLNTVFLFPLNSMSQSRSDLAITQSAHSYLILELLRQLGINFSILHQFGHSLCSLGLKTDMSQGRFDLVTIQ